MPDSFELGPEDRQALLGGGQRTTGPVEPERLGLLRERGCHRIFVEGGGVTVSMFLQADLLATDGANHAELWSAFAKRGMGFSAIAPPATTTSGVQEAFDLPDDLGVSGPGPRLLLPHDREAAGDRGFAGGGGSGAHG